MEEAKEKRYKYIFFDIFDTILSRNVEPEYVKKIWAGQITKVLDLNINMETLYLERNKIETTLGQENHNKGKDFEFTYDEMIKKLHEKLGIKISYKKFLKMSETLEISIESKVLYPNEDIIDIIKQLKKIGKKIYCISDMYLSKNMIKQIFGNLKILDLIDDFYISCEYLNNKKSGILYNIVKQKLKLNFDECYMIGDNKSSDYEIPQSLGIKSFLLDRSNKYEYYETFKKENTPKIVYDKMKSLTLTKSESFEHCIFSLYNFIEKIYYSLKREGAQEVFFLSREGEFLKKLFEKYQENNIGEKIKTHYLLVSRKATYLPSLKKIEEEDFAALLNQYSYLSINEFLKSLNFTTDEINKIKESYVEDLEENTQNFYFTNDEMTVVNNILVKDFDRKIGYFKDSSTFERIIHNKTFIEIYEKNRKEQKNNFEKYIKSMSDSKKITVVDIGWNGSIQNNIQNILGEDYKIKGYYFGLQKKDLKEKIEKKGLIFSNYPKESLNYYLYNENRAIFEIILGASHGSANRYLKKGKTIEVQLYKKQEEEKLFKDVISKIQDNMYKLFEEITKLLQNSYYNNCEINKLINLTHFNMVYNPTEQQINFFNKIYHYENFGVFEFTKFKNNNKISLKRQIKEHIKFFLKYNTYFYDTYWPISKLHNNKLYLEKKLYFIKKLNRYKKSGLI